MLFVPPVAPGFMLDDSHEPMVNIVRFGDGYSQRARKGINSDLEKPLVHWENLTQTEFDYIWGFMVDRLGVQNFDYALPWVSGDTALTYICPSYTRQKTDIGTYSISCQWEQVIESATDFGFYIGGIISSSIINLNAVTNGATSLAAGLTNGILLSGVVPSNTLVITQPPGMTYAGWNWQFGWDNRFDIIPDGDTSKSFYIRGSTTGPSVLVNNASYASGEAARADFGTQYVTGYSSYRFYFLDSPVSDNTGGASLSIKVYGGA